MARFLSLSTTKGVLALVTSTSSDGVEEGCLAAAVVLQGDGRSDLDSNSTSGDWGSSGHHHGRSGGDRSSAVVPGGRSGGGAAGGRRGCVGESSGSGGGGGGETTVAKGNHEVDLKLW